MRTQVQARLSGTGIGPQPLSSAVRGLVGPVGPIASPTLFCLAMACGCCFKRYQYLRPNLLSVELQDIHESSPSHYIGVTQIGSLKRGKDREEQRCRKRVLRIRPSSTKGVELLGIHWQ